MKQFKRPKDQLIEPEDGAFVDEGDVEGHSLPIPAPPGLLPDTLHDGSDSVIAGDDDDREPHPIR